MESSALETFLEKERLSLGDVLHHGALGKLFYWFLVSRFAVETLLFHATVSEFQDAVKRGDLQQAQQLKTRIAEDFLGPNSAFEVVARKGGLPDLNALPPNEMPPANLFDQIMEVNTRDMSRSLQAFWGSPQIASYVRHREILDGLNQDGIPLAYFRKHAVVSPRTAADNEKQREETVLQVRRAYGTMGNLRLVLCNQVGSPYLYDVMHADGTKLGFCKEAAGDLVFVDLSEKPLLSVPSAVFFGNRVIKKADVAQPQQPDRDQAGSGCCRSRSGSAGTNDAARGAAGHSVNEEEWMVKVNGKPMGPVKHSDLLIWWKFHMLPESTHVRSQHQNDYVQVKEIPEHFSPVALIQLVDPTTLNEMF